MLLRSENLWQVLSDPDLPIYVLAVFDGEHVQPLGTDTAVENAIGPDSVGPDLLFLKVAFQRLAVEGGIASLYTQ